MYQDRIPLAITALIALFHHVLEFKAFTFNTLGRYTYVQKMFRGATPVTQHLNIGPK